MVHDRTWVTVTIVLCSLFAALALPTFVAARGVTVAIVSVLMGWAVIWAVYLTRAWVFSRPELGNRQLPDREAQASQSQRVARLEEDQGGSRRGG